MTQWNFGYGDFDLDTPFSEIKGDGWESINNLHELYEMLRILQPGAINNGIVAENTSLSEKTYYENLYVIDGALLNYSGGDIYVFGDCFIYSARMTCKNLYVMGNLYVQREVDDTSYTNLLTVDSLHVAGDVLTDYTTWTMEAAEEQWIGGNLTISNPVSGTLNSQSTGSLSSVQQYNLHIGGDFTYTGAINGYGGVYASGNNQYGYFGRGLHFHVDGDIDLTGCTAINLSGGSTAGYTSYASAAGNGGELTLSANGSILFPASAITINASGGDSTVDGTPSNGGDGGTVVVAGTQSGTSPTVDVSAGTGYDANGSDGTSTNQSTIVSGHAPGQPSPTTPDGETTSTLEFSIPADSNASTLHFEVKIWAVFDPSHLYFVCVSESDGGHAGRFSGTPPYDEGAGSVTYTIGSECETGLRYRWQVTAYKSDGSVYGLPSIQRYFVMA